MSEAIYIGIDPGKSGAISVLDHVGAVVVCIRNDMTEHDVVDSLRAAIADKTARACIEVVSAMPKQGVSSTFKFGVSYGFLRGILVVMQIPFIEVTPSIWQGFMKCRSKGDKNVTKAAAQKLWPHEKITHGNADSLLIAEFGRRGWTD